MSNEKVRHVRVGAWVYHLLPKVRGYVFPSINEAKREMTELVRIDGLEAVRAFNTRQFKNQREINLTLNWLHSVAAKNEASKAAAVQAAA